MSLRHTHRDALIPLIEGETLKLTKAEVVERLEQVGVPCAPIADFDAVFNDEHLTARNFFWDAPHRAVGTVRQLGSPLRLSRTPPHCGAAAPMLGEHT